MIGAAPVLILMYHRVADLGRDVHDLCVTPEHFSDQMAHLAARERAVPLVEARDRRRRRRVVVTFDDGYADNVTAGVPILEQHGVPATFFVTVDLVDATREQWHDELELLLLEGVPRTRHLELTVDGHRLVADVGDEPARRRAHWAIYHRLRPLRRPRIDEVLGQIREQVDAPSATRASHRFMTSDELRVAARSPYVDIGGHAVSHQLLASLDPEEQREEIVGGRRQLRSLTGTDVRTFAYPYGGPEAFDETSVRLVEEAGYDLACVGSGGLMRPGADRFRLPRVVVKDWDVATFASRLDAWFRG